MKEKMKMVVKGISRKIFRRIGWEIVQQFMSEGHINYFQVLSNKFASEGCLGSTFSRTKTFCFENSVFLTLDLGMREGVSEGSRSGKG